MKRFSLKDVVKVRGKTISGVTEKQFNDAQNKIIEFAERHGFVWNTDGPVANRIAKIAKYNMNCLCDVHRKCPCPQAVEDVPKEGVCYCKLLCDKQYLKDHELEEAK